MLPVDFIHAVLHVQRLKKGTPATHPVVGDELRALRKLQREQDPNSPFVFTSERGVAVHDGRLCPHGGACWCRGHVRLSGPILTCCATNGGTRLGAILEQPAVV